jgi:hypothetical protein
MNTQDISNIRSAKDPFIYCYRASDRSLFHIEKNGRIACYSPPFWTPAQFYYNLLKNELLSHVKSENMGTDSAVIDRACELFEIKYGHKRQMENEWWCANEDYAIQNAAAFVLFAGEPDDEKLKQLVTVIMTKRKPAYFNLRGFSSDSELVRVLRHNIHWEANPNEVWLPPEELQDLRLLVSSLSTIQSEQLKSCETYRSEPCPAEEDKPSDEELAEIKRQDALRKAELSKRPGVHIDYDVSLSEGARSLVEFGAFCPRLINPNSTFILDIWAYATKDYEAVSKIAKGLDRELNIARKPGVAVSSGSLMTVQVNVPSLIICDNIDTIVWSGEPVNTSFIVEVPASASFGTHPGTAVIAANGIGIAKLAFLILVSRAEDKEYFDRSTKKRIINTAFASYASEDRVEVLSRVQGMKKIVPALDIFLDVLSLRSGDDWEKQLEKHVPSRDCFYLFWSMGASQSLWVDREWRLALSKRGVDYIDPVPLVDPQIVPPPNELRSLHFGDAYLAYIEYEKIKRDRVP